MIQLNAISKTYGDKVVLEDVSFVISNNQKVGLIAPNGTGKSTLLKVILGLVEPDKGTVVTQNEEIGYLPQVLKHGNGETIYTYLRKNIKEDWQEYQIDTALAEVGLSINKNSLLADLSGGEKTKVGLADLLVKGSTTLLLDEPTNNLDIETMEWLESFVKSFIGSILLISHDRTFLDNTVSKIFELNLYSHAIQTYTGGYTDFVEEKQRRFEIQMQEFNDYQEKKKEMEHWIAEKQVQLSIHRNPKVGRQLQAMKTRYEREIMEKSVERPQENRIIKIKTIAEESHKKKVIFFVENLKFKDLFTCSKLVISAGDRVHLKGRNGVGKTTFIKLLLGEEEDYQGSIFKGENISIGYFSQDHKVLDSKKMVIEQFMISTGIEEEVKARRILGSFLFKGSHVFTKIEKISQGEKVKLIIAQLIHKNNQFLILDEPTNHLDIESREVLEEALNQYHGGFMIISHDRYFLKRIQINKTIRIISGVVDYTVL